MTKIANQTSYIPDEQINGKDYLPGTDFDQQAKTTVSFRVEDLGAHYNSVNGVRNLDYVFYQHAGPSATPSEGYFYSNGNIQDPNGITHFYFSKKTQRGKDVTQFFQSILDTNPFDLIVSQKEGINAMFYFRINEVTEFGGYFRLNVSEVFFPENSVLEYTLSYANFNIKSSGAIQDNSFRFINTGNTSILTSLNYAPIDETLIHTHFDNYFANNSLTVNETQLIIFKVKVVIEVRNELDVLLTKYTQDRKYYSIIGKGVYAPMAPSFTGENLEIDYVQAQPVVINVQDIENDTVNNVVFDLGDITSEDYLDYINTISNITYPTGYPLTDNTKIYYFKWVDDGVTYMYYFDQANSVNGYGTYGVDGDFVFLLAELVLFYSSEDVPGPISLHPVAYSGNYSDLTGTPDLSLKQDVLTESNFGAFSNALATEDDIQDSDKLTFTDSSDSNKQKKTTWLNLKAKLSTVYNALFVPLTRSITINDVTQDLSSDRSFTISGGGASPKYATLTSSQLASQDVDGIKAYIDALNPNIVIAANELYDFIVTDTRQIFKLYLSGVTIGLGQTEITTSDVQEIEIGQQLKTERGWIPIGHSSTVITSVGVPALTLVGTAQSNPVDSGVLYNKRMITSARSSVVAGNSAGWTNQGTYFAFLEPSLEWKHEFYFGDSSPVNITDKRLFVGFKFTIGGIGNVNPSTIPRIYGIGADGADTNLQIYYSEGLGVPLKIDLGSNFNKNNVTDFFYFSLKKIKNERNIEYYVKNLDTGLVTSGIFSYLSAADTFYGLEQIHINNNTTAAEARISISEIKRTVYHV